MRFTDSFDWSLDKQLDETEQTLKQLYLEGRPLPPDHPLSGELRQEFLEEKSFFLPGHDIFVSRHLRYLPCNRHSHDFLEIICVIQGCCTHYTAEQETLLEEGDVCIVAPNTRHALSVFSDESIVLNILIRVSTFETAFFGTLIDDNILSRFFKHTLYHSKTYPYLLFRTGKDQRLFNFVGYAYEEFSGNSPYKNRMVDSIILGFFVMLLRNHGADVILPALPPADQDKRVFEILEYMQRNFVTATLSETASVFHYSERHLQRLVVHTTGMSFSANILKLKMERAKRLLSGSDLPVASIAETLGYSDVRNFRQMFKKYFGLSPTEYRTKTP